MQQKAAEQRITLDDTLKLQPRLPAHVRIVGLDTSYTPTRVIIECEEHGQDRVPKGYLTREGGHGCPRCGDERVGYTEHRLKRLLVTGERGEPCWIGIMDVEVFGIQSVKVGFTSRTLEARYGIALKAIHFSAQLDEIDAIALETEIHSQFNQQSDLRILKAGMRNGERWRGDTECYWPQARSAIIEFTKGRIALLEKEKPDYWNIAARLERPDFRVRSVERQEGVWNTAKPVFGIDDSNNAVRYPSLTEAAELLNISHGNISMVLRGERNKTGGLRWVSEEDYLAGRIPPVVPRKAHNARPVVCLDTRERYDNATVAADATGCQSSHITSVCKGRRSRAGGNRWAYVDVEQLK
jgi:hypothetical protein